MVSGKLLSMIRKCPQHLTNNSGANPVRFFLFYKIKKYVPHIKNVYNEYQISLKLKRYIIVKKKIQTKERHHSLDVNITEEENEWCDM